MNHVFMGISLCSYACSYISLNFIYFIQNFTNNYKIGIQNKNSQIKANFKQYIKILFVWLRFYLPVNSYRTVETVSSLNHTFFLGKVD